MVKMKSLLFNSARLLRMAPAGICHQGAEAEMQRLWQTWNKLGLSQASGHGRVSSHYTSLSLAHSTVVRDGQVVFGNTHINITRLCYLFIPKLFLLQTIGIQFPFHLQFSFSEYWDTAGTSPTTQTEQLHPRPRPDILKVGWVETWLSSSGPRLAILAHIVWELPLDFEMPPMKLILRKV